jgi:hypothetical protein
MRLDRRMLKYVRYLWRGIWILFVALMLTFAFPPRAHAEVFIVDMFFDDPTAMTCADAVPDDCSLRGAIVLANVTAGSDTIILDSGVYPLTFGGSGDDLALEGDLDITVDSVTINGEGSGQTIIDGGSIDQVFQVMPGAVLSLNGLTVQNGSGPTAGGIHNTGVLTLDDVFVSNNTGDGIFNEGILTLENGKVDNNSESGIASSPSPYAEVIVLNSRISENDLTGINTQNTILTVDMSMVDGNQEGGIFAIGSEVTVVDSTISGNMSSGVGGGLFLSLDAGDRILRSTISGNTAVGDGGGIYFWGSLMGENHLVLENVTITGNQAGENGGGLIADSGAGSEVAMFNVTIAKNEADYNGNNDGDGGGIYNQNGARVSINNSLLAANLDGTGSGSNVPDCSGALDSGGYNLFGAVDGNCTITGTTTGNQAGTIPAPLDPVIGGLGDNGGPTYTHALLMGSPALEAGDPAGCEKFGGSVFSDDQRRWTRPIDVDLDGTAICDIGAFERTIDICLPLISH